MGGSHSGDHSDVRRGDLGESVDLAWTIGSKLHNHHLVVFFLTKECQRQADEIVEVTFGFQNSTAKRLFVQRCFLENRRNHLLGSSFAVGSSNRQHFRRNYLAAIMSQIAERS